MGLVPMPRQFRMCVAISLVVCSAPACPAELVGRVVDTMNAKVFAGAVVHVRDGARDSRSARTDAHGFFRLSGLAPGAYLIDVATPDGNDFVARLVLLQDRKTQFLELDYSRIVPPDEDEHY